MRCSKLMCKFLTTNEPVTDHLHAGDQTSLGGQLSVKGKENSQGLPGTSNAAAHRRSSSISAPSGLALNFEAMGGNDFLNIVAKPSLNAKRSLSSASHLQGDFDWRDSNSGINDYSTGLAPPELVQGNTFDFGHMQPVKSPGGLLPRFAANGAAAKIAVNVSAANAGYLRANQAHLVMQQQQQDSTKLDEHRDGSLTGAFICVV